MTGSRNSRKEPKAHGDKTISAGWMLLTALSLALGACGPAGPGRPTEESSGSRGQGRTLVMALREPGTLTTRPLGEAGQGRTMIRELFNSQIAQRDDRGEFRPYLVEALPRLGTGTWSVLPDGRMETTYRLKPGLAWHDGALLVPEDFVFLWQIHSNPTFGMAKAPPFVFIESVAASDDRTFVIRWARPYPAAGTLSSPSGATDDEFQPLPHHLLEQDVRETPPDPFAHHPYWTAEFVGLGPYRLDRWEPGAFIQAGSFDRYVFGRPRVERVKLIFISDPNTIVANLLAGEVHLAADNSIGFENVEALKRAGWNGTILSTAATSWRITFFQLRPDLVSPRAILDLRVRKALAHAVDRDSINGIVGRGTLDLADSMMQAGEEFGPAAARGAVKYAFDPRRSKQLMSEAGFSRGGDSLYVSPEGRFSASLSTAISAGYEREIFIMADGWRKAGFNVQEAVIPAARALDFELAATFPAMSTRTTRSGPSALANYTTQAIPSAENRWVGQNRGGWSNPEFDQLVDRFNTTLDASERAQQVETFVGVFTSNLPAIPLYFNSGALAYAAGLRGVQSVPAGGNQLSNLHEWEFY